MFKQLLTRVSFIVAIAQAGLAAQAPAARGQAAAAPAQSGKAETREINLRAYAELLRSDVRAQKVALITELMEFTEAEDTAFWPLYREYDLELTKISDERVTLIENYSKNYDKLTDAVADQLATKALELEARRTALKSTYYGRLKTKLSAKTAARLLQVENQITQIIDLQISASLPVIK